jgi:heme-degrading monooxygenase HmoA
VSAVPPYFAVIFTTIRNAQPDDGYAETAARMDELARQQPGYLGIESVHDPAGHGITVSYWATEAALQAWGRNAEHLLAQKFGREKWYQSFTLRVCKVEQVRSFTRGEAT